MRLRVSVCAHVGGRMPTARYLGMIVSPFADVFGSLALVSLCTHNSDYAGWE